MHQVDESVSLPSELAAFVTALPSPVLLFSSRLKIAAASRPYLALMGISPPDLVGRDIRDAFHGSDSLEPLVASLLAALKTRKPHQMAPGLFKTGDAGQHHQRLLQVVNSPMVTGDDEPRWIVHHATEPASSSAHEQSALALALQGTEARLRSILRTVPDAMIIIDGRGRIESLSSTAERLFGYTMDEVAGENISRFMPTPHREQHDGYLERYLETGVRHIIGIGRIVVGQRKDGTTFPMHLTIGELRSADGHYFTGFIRDLTDQQMTESRLKELQSEVTHMSRFTALGEMASTLAHEINQPLTAITNYLKGCHRLLEKAGDAPAPALRDALSKAADQALRAGRIIQRLREFVARGDSERQAENLPKLIEDASTLALIGARENGISVSFRLDSRASAVLADRIQIQQVLVNLIRNAIEVLADHNGPRKLEITTSMQTGDMVEVRVADSGPGLAPAVAAQLFQPFVTTKEKGMGLGLSICRTIVEAHGGKIWVDAPSQGGAAFHFTLHASDEQEEVDLAQ